MSVCLLLVRGERESGACSGRSLVRESLLRTSVSFLKRRSFVDRDLGVCCPAKRTVAKSAVQMEEGDRSIGLLSRRSRRR
jgi:hypothetical protein